METKSPFSNALGVLFQEFTQERKYCSHLSPETLRGYTSVFALFAKVIPEVSSVDDLNAHMLVEFFRRIETRPRIVGRNTLRVGVKASTIKTQWSKLNVFFSWLRSKGHLKENPLSGIKPPHPRYEDPKALEDAQIHRLYSAISLHSANAFLLRRDTMILSILLYCGLRKSELLGLQARDIDLYKRELTVRADTSKSKNWRILKLHPVLHLHIAEYLKARNMLGHNTEWLIAANRDDRKLTDEGIRHWVTATIKKSGVKFHLHQLRHTFACKLAEADVNPFKIQKLLGHTSLAMTMKYIRSLDTQNMQDDIERIKI